MQLTLTLLVAASMAALTNAHGYFVTPKARVPGPAMQATCGQQAYNMMASDINGNIQGLQQVIKGQSDYHAADCNLWRCKGMKYADNKANVHAYKPGQSIPMNFAIRAPHTGYANVSIIKTSTNKVIAANLKKWDVYASNSVPTVASQENFSITMPSNLGTKCAKAGDCAIQMHWNAPDIDQTYQSCIDFTLSGSAKRWEIEEGEEVERLHPRDFGGSLAADDVLTAEA